MASKKYLCKVCGYIHTGDAAPDVCPVCKATASEFELQKPKGLFADKNSNAYILTYSTVMVVVVAAVLAFLALSLKPLQQANVLNEKKGAILTALGAADESYDDYITAFVVDKRGKKIEGADAIALLSDLGGAYAAGTLPVFMSKDGKVVLPVTGTGLWGPIWGYVALESDLNTIAGIVIDHASETPGLGAEIATAKHQSMYVGKKIFEGNTFVSVSLVKGGASKTEPAASHEVDAITGGTKTSDGVTNMLKESLGSYLPLLKSTKSNKK